MRRLWLLLILALAGCRGWSGVVPIAPPEPPPVTPPPPPPPVDPPLPPVTPPGEVPAIGTTKAAVEAAWGKPTEDLPENPGEDDAVSYLRTIGGREAEVHVIYRDGRVLRSVVTYLVRPGGG